MASQLTACRLLASILLANLTCLSVLNALRAPTQALLLYPAVVAAIWFALKPRLIRSPRTTLPRAAFLLAAACLVLLTLPRLPYLLEWIPGNTVLAQADDYGRLAELISLTQSSHFPPVHPSNQQYLLSHYFAALLPMAWLKFAVPLLTLKDCILVGNLFYHALMLLALLEFARHTMPTPRRALALVFLVTLFSGIDWVTDWSVPFSHSEHWPRASLGVLREVSSFYTAHYWVVHHMAAFWALVLAMLYASRAQFGSRRTKQLFVSGLILAAAVHSPFVLLGALACFPREIVRSGLRSLRNGTALLLLLLALPVLPFFLGRLQTRSLWWHPVVLPGLVSPWNWIAGLAAYLSGIVFIELAGLPILLALAWKRLPARERTWAFGAAGFTILTWCIESVGYNNFAMRGLLIPCFAVFWLCARHATGSLPRAAVIALVVVVSWGTFREAAWLTYQPLQFSYWYWRVRGLDPPPQARALLREAYGRLARDPRPSYYVPDHADRFGLTKFNAEKLVRGIPPEQMDEAERELARRSLWGW